MALSKSSPHVKSKQYLEREIRMVLVGKTGVGKSATGNTIAGTNVFREDLSAKSVTAMCQQHSFDRDGYELQLVDAPGFCDTDRSAEDNRKEMGRCVAMSSPGIHAILFIISVGRFTKEDKAAIDDFINFLGEECKRYILVIFTEKDKLDKRKRTINEYVRTSPESLKLFLQTVQGRYMAVNNNDKSQDKKTFTKELVVRVSQMVQANGGMCYTNSMYRKAESQLREAEDEEKKKIAAEKEASNKELIERERDRIEADLRKQLLPEQEHERKKIKEIKALKDSIEDDCRKQARRRVRSNIGHIVGSLLAIPAAVAGSCVAGPVVIVAGATAGAITGSFLGSHLGAKDW